MNAESSDRANLRHFTQISSDIYRDLGAHYEQVFEEWVAEEGAEVAEDT
jgi:alpha-mannosidase